MSCPWTMAGARRHLFRLIAFALLGIALVAGGASMASEIYPGKSWQKYATPEKAGWSSSKLSEAETFASTIGSSAVVIVHDGRIVASWGEVERKFGAHSIRKSFLSALYGINVAEGRLDLSASLAQLGIDDDPPLMAVEKQARLIDLLKLRSGVYHEAAYQTKASRRSMPDRGSVKPGERFNYNNWDINVLNVVLERATGRTVFEQLKKRIATPLQMEHFSTEDGEYVFEKDVSIHPGFVFDMSALDMARFGLLYLRGGKWRDKQIVPEQWIRDSTTAYSFKDARGRTGRWGYGYLWWIRTKKGALKSLGLYEARGSGGHTIDILPGGNLVVVHRVDNERVGGRCRRHLLSMILKASSRWESLWDERQWAKMSRRAAKRCG